MKRSLAIFGMTMMFLAAGVTARAGQLFQATLTAAQEVPSNASTATGSGSVVLSDDQTTITVNLSFSGLITNATAAHIHGPRIRESMRRCSSHWRAFGGDFR